MEWMGDAVVDVVVDEEEGVLADRAVAVAVVGLCGAGGANEWQECSRAEARRSDRRLDGFMTDVIII